MTAKIQIAALEARRISSQALGETNDVSSWLAYVAMKIRFAAAKGRFRVSVDTEGFPETLVVAGREALEVDGYVAWWNGADHHTLIVSWEEE